MKPKRYHLAALLWTSLLFLFCILVSSTTFGQTISGPTSMTPTSTSQTYTLTVPGGVLPTNIVWSVKGDLQITSPNGGTSITIASFDKSGLSGGRGKGRVFVSYVNASLPTSICGTIIWKVQLDVYKTFNDVFPITGPQCVSVGDVVTYSIPPYVSVNIGDEIGIDTYKWNIPGGLSLLYQSSDLSSATYKVISIPTTPLQVDMGKNNLASPSSTLTLQAKIAAPAFTIAPPVCLATNINTFKVKFTPQSGRTYSWNVPPEWSITYIQPDGSEIDVNTDTGPGTLTLTVSNSSSSPSCSSFTQQYNIRRGLSSTDVINGPACVSKGGTYRYSVDNVRTNITWTLPGGWINKTTPANSTSIIVEVPASPASSSGTITAVAASGCPSATISLPVAITPDNPGSITGPVCLPTASVAPVVYSIAPVNGAVSYTWNLPGGGWTISAGAGTNSITVVPNGTSGGTVSVTCNGINACLSATTSLAVAYAPATPGGIIGPKCLEPGSSSPLSYSVPPIPNATGYEWTLPTGWTGNGSTTNVVTTTTNTIIATPNGSIGPDATPVGPTAGNIAVKALGCVNSGSSVAPISVFGNQGYQFTISALNVFPTYTIYTVNAPGFIPGGESYNWTLDGQPIGTFSSVFVSAGTNPRNLCVSIKRTSDCLSASACLNVTAARIGTDTNTSLEMTASPNPVSRTLKLNLPTSTTSYQVAVLDEKGNMVKQLSLTSKNAKIDMSTLASGVYVVIANNGSQSFAKRIIKQ